MGLFLLTNLLDFATTYAASRMAGEILVELSPFVNFFGWNEAITFKLLWILVAGSAAFYWWEKDPKACKAFLMIMTTLFACAALFNVIPTINPDHGNRIFCWSVNNWKYVRNLLHENLSISDFQNILDVCYVGYTH